MAEQLQMNRLAAPGLNMAALPDGSGLQLRNE
jgi:hypothetical protein